MALMGRTTSEAFETRLLAHIREFFPVHWREVGEEHLREVIRIGITNGAVHEMETQREIYLFISLMLYLGSSFDTDDQLPWAAAGLDDGSEADPFMRVEKTYNLAVEYLDRVAGPDGQYSAAAIQRFIKVLRDPTRGMPDLSETLRSIHPEKSRQLSPAQLQSVVQQGHACVLKYGLEAEGALLCAGLTFLLGHGFATDPQFPWAAEVLNDAGIPDSAQRLKALKQTSVIHLNRWFAGTEKAA